jgi:hypothetical protein
VAAYSSLCLVFDGAGVAHWDPTTMEEGLSLAGQLRKAIQACELCVFLATKRSLDSPWCSAELGAFWGAGKRVIGYLADGTVNESDLPPHLRGDLWTADARKMLKTVQSAMEVEQLKRVPGASQFRAACCRIGIRGRPDDSENSFTGYLIDKSFLATADYIKQGPDDPDALTVQFGRSTHREARPALVDDVLGLALLSLDSPLEGVDPLPLLEHCSIGTMFQGFGFPEITRGTGVPFTGEVVDPEFEDERGHLRVLIHSPALTSGYLRGMGGAPIWAGGAVIGHLDYIFHDEGRQYRSAFGLVVATPAFSVLRLFNKLRQQ